MSLRIRMGVATALMTSAFFAGCSRETPPGPQTSGQASPSAEQSLALSPAEFEKFKVQPVEERVFALRREAVGGIAFNAEMSADVFPTVAGKILKLSASVGDDVAEGVPLYTINSPDLAQAESTLIAAAGTLDLTNSVLERAKKLIEVQGAAQADLDLAVSNQKTADAALKAAREAVRIFGKTDAEIDKMVADRKIDPVLAVKSPMAGRVTARTAAPGVLTQPGVQPAPYTISDVSTLWMLANVAESDFAVLKMKQSVEVAVKAYPDRTFHGEIVNIGASVDPSTRRITVRSLIQDPQHELRPGMFATFAIQIGEARSPAVPRNGVIREGDGTWSVWVAPDEKSVARRTVKIGIQQEGFVQIVEGLKPGERVATEAALFLSNALTGSPSD